MAVCYAHPMPRWTTIDLEYTPPYDLAGVLAFLGKRTIAGIEQVRDGFLAKSNWFDQARLRTLCDQHAAAPWLRVQRIRNMIGIPKSMTVLFRMLAFECWYETLIASTRSKAVIA